MKKKYFYLALLSAVLIFSLHHLLPSETIQERQELKPLEYKVTVVLKLVQVFVTDNKGKPVMDLRKDDFLVYDNGKLQTITEFERHILPQAEKLSQPEKKAEEELLETEIPPAQEMASKMNRKFFFLLDISFNDGLGMIKSKKAALHFMDTQVQPTDEIAFITYSTISGLGVREHLTTDHEKIRKAIQRTRELPGGLEGGEEITAANELIKRQILQYLEEIRLFAKSLRYVPGYKNIIFFSAGIDRTLLYDSEDPSIRYELEGLSRELSASSCPVYTVNTEGMRALAKPHEERGDHSLRMISDLSGGKYFMDVARYEKISEEIQDLTSNYYVLGYYVDEKWDGTYHEIKVKVKREGCQVQAQSGYYNPEPFKKFTEFENQLHLIDLALSDKPHFQDPLHFPLTALPFSGQEDSNIALISKIPSKIIEQTGEEESEIVALVFDQDNNVVASCNTEVDFSKMPKETFYPWAVLSLPPGEYKCRMVIRNLNTGKGAVGASSAVISEPESSRIKLYPPLLLAQGEKISYLEIPQKRKEAGEEAVLYEIYPFLSEKYAPLLGEINRKTSKVLAAVGCSTFNIPAPEIDISAYLVDPVARERTSLSYSVVSIDSKEETQIFILELQLPELRTGEYTLEIIAEEVKTQSRSEVKTDFSVK
jgi:VWFA-related protein